jgi:serine protease Do
MHPRIIDGSTNAAPSATGKGTMSTQSKNWIKLGTLVAAAFVVGMFFAGLMNFPRTGNAQERASHTPIVRVDAPRIPAAHGLVDLSDAYAAVAEVTRPSVVYVQSERPMDAESEKMMIQLPGMQQAIPRNQLRGLRPKDEAPSLEHSSGSGFIVSSDGYILTNNHVIEGSSKVTVRLLDGREYDAKIIGTDQDTDVGVLKIDAKGLTPAALGSSDATRVGEWVLAIGNPLGDELTFTVTQGIVSAKGRAHLAFDGKQHTLNIQDYIQTDAVINRGNSGGPLVNSRGEVVGINAAIASTTGSYTGYAFAVPIDLARKVMDQIVANGRVRRAGLGISVADADRDDADYLGLSCICGVSVGSFGKTDVTANSPAEKAGIRTGDVITAIDDQPVKYVAQLQQNVGFRNPGESVKVDVMRKDGKHTFNIKLVSISEPATEAAAAPEAPKGEAASTTKSILGMVTEPLTAQTANEVGLPSTQRGMLVKSIVDGSVASTKLVTTICPVDGNCGAPDVIISVEGKPVKTDEELKSALGGAVHGIVTLEVVSGSKERTIAATRIVRVRLK